MDKFNKEKLDLSTLDYDNLIKNKEHRTLIESTIQKIYNEEIVELNSQEQLILDSFIKDLRLNPSLGENEKNLVLMYQQYNTKDQTSQHSNLERAQLDLEIHKFNKHIKLEKNREKYRKWLLIGSYAIGVIFVIFLMFCLYRWIFGNSNTDIIYIIFNKKDVFWHIALVFILPATTILFCMIRSATHKPVKNDNEADTPQLEALKQALEVVEKARDIVTMKKSDK